MKIRDERTGTCEFVNIEISGWFLWKGVLYVKTYVNSAWPIQDATAHVEFYPSELVERVNVEIALKS